MEPVDELDVLFQALAHRVRRCIVGVLGREGGRGYAELMRACGIDDSGTFAFHLRRLRGLVVKDGDSGVYVLTELGRRAYSVLEFLEGRVDRGSGGEPVVLRDRVRLVLGEDHLRWARGAGRRIVVRDVGELVIERVPVDLFDQVVESIRDVGVVRAPVELRAVVDGKVRDVFRVVYYGDDGGEGGGSGGVSGLARGLSAVLARVLARGFGGGFAEREVSSSGVFGGGRLVVEASACSLSLEAYGGDRVRLRARGLGVDAGVEGVEGGVRVWCRSVGGGWGRVLVPARHIAGLVLRVDACDVVLRSLFAVSSFEASVEAGVVDGRVSLWGRGPRVVLEGSAGVLRVGLDFSRGEWGGVASVSGVFEASSASLELVVGGGVGVRVEAGDDPSFDYRLVVDGVPRGLPYREDGERVVEVVLRGSASSVRVGVERVGSS